MSGEAQFLVHPRLTENGFEFDQAELLKKLPSFRPFKGERYSSLLVVLDWDHRLPYQLVPLRIYGTFDEAGTQQLRAAVEERQEEIKADNLYPEFDLPDFAGLPANETYLAACDPSTLKFEDIYFESSWRRDVEPALLRETLLFLRGHKSYEQMLEKRDHQPPGLGDLIVAGWAPPCLAQSENWAIELWLVMSFDGQHGRAHVWMIDPEEKKIVRQYLTDVHAS